MSVIYKALRTIEAADGAPRITDRAGKRRPHGVGGLKVCGGIGIVVAVCVVVVVNVLQRPPLSPTGIDGQPAVSTEPSLPGAMTSESKRGPAVETTVVPTRRALVETAAPVVASVAGIGFGRVANNVSASPVDKLLFQPVSFGPDRSPRAATDAIANDAFGAVPAALNGNAASTQAARASPSPTTAGRSEDSRQAASEARPLVDLPADAAEASMATTAAIAPLGPNVDDHSLNAGPSALAAPPSSRQAIDSGTSPANRTRRVRLLDANLSRAIKQRDLDEVSRIVDEMGSLLGADSVYMMKIRAFTQLSTGGDNERAMHLLREVLVREPGDKEAALNMAVAEIKLGETGEARQRLELLAAVYPDEPAIRNLLRSLQ